VNASADVDPIIVCLLPGRVRERVQTNLQPLLHITDPPTVRQVLTDRRVAKTKDYAHVFGALFGEGLVTSEGDKHRHDHALLAKFFNASNLQNYIQAMCEYADEGIARLLEPHEGQRMNITTMMHLTSLRIAWKIVFSVDIWEDLDLAVHISEMVSEGSLVMGKCMALGMPVWSIIPEVRRMFDNRREHEDIVVGYAAKRRALMADKQPVPDDPLTAMILDGKTDKQMMDHCLTMISAGHDTSSFSLAYLCYLLSKNPAKQELVREEVQRVIGDRRAITQEDLDKLVYLQQAMQESARIFAVIPGVKRLATADIKIKTSGKVIPAGTNIVVPMTNMFRDAEIWDNPAEYRPERMEGIPFTSAKHGFIPFAYGTRACIGGTLAVTESKMIIAKILQRYRIKEDPDFKLQILGGISLTSERVNVILERLPSPANE